ncbi:MAG: phosphoesterase [Clostridia bacterium]|nr:phosphoesterase [Clostridia bacterium]
MRFKSDLHIHSALSPCADDENTPNNIVSLSKMLGTQVIAVADHNSILNVTATVCVGNREGLLVIPAMEVTTSEDIHVLCLFPTYESALPVYSAVDESLPRFPLNEKIYFSESVMDENDNVIKRLDYLLSVACGIDIYELCEMVWDVGGVAIPAHIDKDANSVIDTLGSVPEDLKTYTVEVSPNCSEEIIDEIKGRYNIISDSDAHALETLCGHEAYIDAEELTIESILKSLRSPPERV